MYKIEPCCQQSYEDSFIMFLHRTIWDSNILDGFDADEVEEMERKLWHDTKFRDEIVQMIGEKIYEKLFTK